MIKTKRRNIKRGRYSRALVIPAPIEKGAESSLAADRLMLVDPRGEIPPEALLKFLEQYVEPQFWAWYKTEARKHE